MADDPYAPITITGSGFTQTFDPKDLSSPKSDTFVLALQWLYASTLDEDERGDNVFGNVVQLGDRDEVWEGDEQIPQLVGQILHYGKRYYPVENGYRHFTADEIALAEKLGHDPDLGLNRKYKAALAKAVEHGDPR